MERFIGLATEEFSTRPPVSFYGSTKLCSEALALEYGAAFGFPVCINRCGVLAGAGQFGKVDQGIFSYWIHAWHARKPLKYIGFGGSGFQVRDGFHPEDLAALVAKQLHRPDGQVDRICNVGGGPVNSISLLQLGAWCTQRLGPHLVASEPATRPFDVPWFVMDARKTMSRWQWQPTGRFEDVLEEIACHAEANPKWIEMVG